MQYRPALTAQLVNRRAAKLREMREPGDDSVLPRADGQESSWPGLGAAAR